jgi:hypothetical protein
LTPPDLRIVTAVYPVNAVPANISGCRSVIFIGFSNGGWNGNSCVEL